MTSQSDPRQEVLFDLPMVALWDAAPDGMVLVAPDGSIVVTNPELDRMFGYASGELHGQSIEVLVPHPAQHRHVALREQFYEHPQRRPMGLGRRLQGLRRDGTTVDVQISLAPIDVRSAIHTLAAVRDITDRAAVEARLEEVDRRRALAEDHDRIARDLHDTVIQELFGVGLGLHGIQSRTDSPEVAARVTQAIDDIDGIIRSIRSTIYELSSTDAPSGPRQRFTAVVSELAGALGFEPHVSMVGPVDGAIPDHVVDHLVPVVREGLTNVARHAAATHVEIALEVGEQVSLTICDNGRGLGDTSRRSGLANLARRAFELGGDFVVRARSDGEGTELRWSVPLQPS